MLRGWAGAGGVPTLLLGTAPLGLDLRPSCRAHLTVLLLPTSWKTGPWTLCSASCGGGSQSRSVYCVSSDGASAQEAAEDAECEGLPEKPPGTRACNLQRCAGWSVEPWSEVSPAPLGWGGHQELGGGPGRPLATLNVLSSSWEAPLGEKGPARWSRRLWSRLGLGAGAWIPAPVLFLLPEGPGRVGKEPGTSFGG